MIFEFIFLCVYILIACMAVITFAVFIAYIHEYYLMYKAKRDFERRQEMYKKRI